jgi:hypothetical protein
MPAVPGHQKITAVIGGQREMQSVTQGIRRHQAVRDVRLNDIQSRMVDREEWGSASSSMHSDRASKSPR